jgi:hypothetical protein
MRRKAVIAAVLAATLVGVVGAEGIFKAREAALPKGSVTVEEVESVVVEASRLDSAEDMSSITVATM